MTRACFRFTGLAFALLLSASLAVPPALAGAASAPAATQSPGALPAAASLGQLPLYFVENRGQLDAQVAFYVLGGGTAVYFTPQGLTLVLSRPGDPADRMPDRLAGGPDLRAPSPAPGPRWAVKLDFVGANPGVRPVGRAQTGAIVSYFHGPEESWHTGLATFSQVVYPDLWPGIDLVYYGQAGALKYEFRLKPGADPGLIRLAYRGIEGLRVDVNGQLAAGTPLGDLVDEAPVAWQDVDGQRAPVAAAYDVAGAGYGFRLGAYDRTRPLVLDPALLVYSGFIGGSSVEEGYAIALDGEGNAYVTGYTYSVDFPVKGGFDTYNGSYPEGFVVKVAADGKSLVYASYIGGSLEDRGTAIAVDSDGNAYIAGYTYSSDFPASVRFGPHSDGTSDAFMAKVTADGKSLAYACYIGGSAEDVANGIALDGLGLAYVTGSHGIDGFPAPGRRARSGLSRRGP